MTGERIFRYVPHSQVAERLEEGWTIAADLGPPHCFYAVLMEAPKKPKNKFRSVVDFVVARATNRAYKKNIDKEGR